MGRKNFFHNAENLQKRLERGTANGFVARAHIEEDAIRRKHHLTDDTKQKQADCVKFYNALVVHTAHFKLRHTDPKYQISGEV